MLGIRARHAWCLGIGLCFVSLLTKVARAEAIVLRNADGTVSALAYPPKSQARPQPMTVMLHGMCGRPENNCPHFADSVTDHGWLICPRAETPCAGKGFSWHHRRGFDTIERAVQNAVEQFPGEIDATHDRTLIGFSLGALLGMNLVQRPDNKYSHVVLIGAKVLPNPELLRTSGVERLVFAAGAYDMMYDHMSKAATFTARKGIATRFWNLGKVGHRYPDNLTEHMHGVFEWLFAPSESGAE